MWTETLSTRERQRSPEPPVKSLETLIAEHPFLAGLKPAHLDVLCDCAMQTQFAKDQLIFREGDLANRFYLIQEGRVALESRAGGERTVLIQTVGAGEVLGWSWLFPPYYWHFDARTLAPTKAIFFYGTRLRAQCEEDHDFGYELMKRMAAVVILRLQAAREQRANSRRKADAGVAD
jgi:CRP/FNR family cyclic AMP-dependent transcriptional regulator